MKKLFLLVVAAVLLNSCSEDEGNAPHIMKFTKKNYENGNYTGKTEYQFLEGLFLLVSNYGTTGGIISYTHYSYVNGSFVCISRSDYRSGGKLEVGKSFLYDSQRRIMHMKHNEQGMDYYVNYTYNHDNTITAVQHGYNAGTKTYHLNDDGFIYKEVLDNSMIEMVYQGRNVVSSSHASITASFEYDQEHDPGLMGVYSYTGGYLNNAILMENSLVGLETFAADRFITKETRGGTVTEYNYTFRSDGRPSKREELVNGMLVSELTYKY